MRRRSRALPGGRLTNKATSASASAAEERLREAAARVSELAGPVPVPGTDAVPRGIGLDAARRALLVEGAVSLRRPPLVVELSPERSIAAGTANHGLADVLRGAASIRLHEAPLDARKLLEQHFERQLVVVMRDAHRHTWERVAAKALQEAAPDAVVVEVGIPAWRPDGSAFIATHGSARVNFQAAAEWLQ
jgi:beta-N-acetylhexosaminidase